MKTKEIDCMFTYSKEKELHEHIVEHFKNYFDFNYVSSEFIISSGRVDIIGKDDSTIYIVEIKRDYITTSTIQQLANYIPDIQRMNPTKTIKGIAVAPYIDDKVNLESLPYNITIQTIDDVTFKEPEHHTTKKRVTFTLDDELLKQLKSISSATSIPQARIVEQAIKEYLEKMK